ncbi:hypothetical protein GPJ56_007098 [Histomonas meleagridis]|uniref:uncharacterized protein n=1 Tax=Histomonas meleagridis TaxID=135588 RepID=UPI00355A225C|nr:hypothetical protein GPJ56_007098 [Histomonas meleagridis]KAH0796107.1 hypothetical protein GO595_011074 [Histomonas meleagridis]
MNKNFKRPQSNELNRLSPRKNAQQGVEASNSNASLPPLKPDEQNNLSQINVIHQEVSELLQDIKMIVDKNQSIESISKDFSEFYDLFGSIFPQFYAQTLRYFNEKSRLEKTAEKTTVLSGKAMIPTSTEVIKTWNNFKTKMQSMSQVIPHAPIVQKHFLAVQQIFDKIIKTNEFQQNKNEKLSPVITGLQSFCQTLSNNIKELFNLSPTSNIKHEKLITYQNDLKSFVSLVNHHFKNNIKECGLTENELHRCKSDITTKITAISNLLKAALDFPSELKALKEKFQKTDDDIQKVFDTIERPFTVIKPSFQSDKENPDLNALKEFRNSVDAFIKNLNTIGDEKQIELNRNVEINPLKAILIDNAPEMIKEYESTFSLVLSKLTAFQTLLDSKSNQIKEQQKEIDELKEKNKKLQEKKVLSIKKSSDFEISSIQKSHLDYAQLRNGILSIALDFSTKYKQPFDCSNWESDEIMIDSIKELIKSAPSIQTQEENEREKNILNTLRNINQSIDLTASVEEQLQKTSDLVYSLSEQLRRSEEINEEYKNAMIQSIITLTAKDYTFSDKETTFSDLSELTSNSMYKIKDLEKQIRKLQAQTCSNLLKIHYSLSTNEIKEDNPELFQIVLDESTKLFKELNKSRHKNITQEESYKTLTKYLQNLINNTKQFFDFQIQSDNSIDLITQYEYTLFDKITELTKQNKSLCNQINSIERIFSSCNIQKLNDLPEMIQMICDDYIKHEKERIQLKEEQNNIKETLINIIHSIESFSLRPLTNKNSEELTINELIIMVNGLLICIPPGGINKQMKIEEINEIFHTSKNPREYLPMFANDYEKLYNTNRSLKGFNDLMKRIFNINELDFQSQFKFERLVECLEKMKTEFEKLDKSEMNNDAFDFISRIISLFEAMTKHISRESEEVR